MMHVLSRILAAALVTVLAGSSAAQEPVPPRLSGCYRVTLGAWQPALDLGPDTVFMQPPARIELRGDTGTAAMERGRWLVRPAPRAAPGRHRFAFWRSGTADSVELTWTTGFSGLRIVAASAPDTLRGRAETFWDFDRARQRAVAELVREPCGGETPAAGHRASVQSYLDERGHVHVSLAQQTLSPNGRSNGPRTMATGGIQRLLAQMVPARASFAAIPSTDGGGRSIAAVNRMMAGAARGVQARPLKPSQGSSD